MSYWKCPECQEYVDPDELEFSFVLYKYLCESCADDVGEDLSDHSSFFDDDEHD